MHMVRKVEVILEKSTQNLTVSSTLLYFEENSLISWREKYSQ